MERLALVADTHTYQGRPALVAGAFSGVRALRHLACLGDCQPEPFRPWLEMDPGNRLYWVYDVFGRSCPKPPPAGWPWNWPDDLPGPHPGPDLDPFQGAGPRA